MRTFLIAGFLALHPSLSLAQSFSCSVGQPSCLGYGDKVVDRDAQCFDSMTCFPGGFVCKSDYENVVSEYDLLASKARSMASNYDTLRNCLARAADMDAVQSCLRTDAIMQ